jgi:amino acid transporter
LSTDLSPDVDAPVHLERRFGLLQATALNMSNMVGIGPFITIPILMSALGGPQAMLGWAVALLITIPDSMVWSELGAAMPGSGGSYIYLRDGFGPKTFGRLIAFLFIWQFIISGPLEIASGYIGFAKYTSYLWPGMEQGHKNAVAALVGVLTVAFLYRRIRSIAKLTVSLWIGTLITTAVVIVSGIFFFNRNTAFDFPPHAFDVNPAFWRGLGAAAAIGIYDYLGYYDICFIGDEVKEPGRVIPRSILISLFAVAVIYLGINLSIIGVVPWREFVPASDANPTSNFVVAVFMQRLYGSTVAQVFTVMVLWTAFASVFALLLGYSRVPYAAANDGYFFKVFGKLHPRGGFPYVSLLVIGSIAIACSFLTLDVVINALLATRILIQFIGQIVAVILLRKRRPDMARPYRIWLYPFSCILALAGWSFLFATLETRHQLYGVAAIAIGVISYFGWALVNRQWPFGRPEPEQSEKRSEG